LRTVEDFISTLQELRRDDGTDVNERRIIINCLSPVVSPHVEEAEIYDRIVQVLKALYVKRPVAKVVSCFFCGLDTHRYRSSCPPRNASCRFCGKRGHFARVCRSKRLSTDVPSAAFAAPAQSVSQPFVASAPSTLASAVVPGTLSDSPIQVLVDSGASENFIDLDVCARLNLRVNGERSSIGMASSEIAVETLGKTTEDLKLLDQTYRHLISES